jgi:hypothetical protein
LYNPKDWEKQNENIISAFEQNGWGIKLFLKPE